MQSRRPYITTYLRRHLGVTGDVQIEAAAAAATAAPAAAASVRLLIEPNARRCRVIPFRLSLCTRRYAE